MLVAYTRFECPLLRILELCPNCPCSHAFTTRFKAPVEANPAARPHNQSSRYGQAARPASIPFEQFVAFVDERSKSNNHSLAD
jgi:hypothetical protein